MIIRALVFVVSAAGVLGSPAIAADPASKKKDRSQQIVCKTDQFVGSRISTRICKTRAEWEQGKSDAKNALDRSLRGPGRDPTPKTGG